MPFNAGSGGNPDVIGDSNALRKLLLQAQLMKMHLAVISRADIKEEDVEDD